ncbi:hypothetical protein GJV11_10665 [Enterobacteriaceae bacterium RIT693]|nr:hypothetical protein [Enterobacteriaceae bacterium RIT693]
MTDTTDEGTVTMKPPAYYRDGVPYDANGQAVTLPPGDTPPPLVTDLGDGSFQFKSQKKACYLMNINALGSTWTMNRDDGGVAACFATEEEKQVAVRLMTGLMPAPEYTAEQADAAMLMLGAPGALALSGGQWSMQLSVAGEGVMTFGDTLAGALTAAIRRGMALLTASTAGPMAMAASTLLFSSPAGEGSGRVPGRNLEAMFALNAKLLAGKNVTGGPGATHIDLPVRGALVNRNGELALALLKTGSGIPAAVQVLHAVRDTATGLDIITLPTMAGEPPRSILINPAPVPAGPSDTGHHRPVPVTPVHTGTNVTPVETLVVTPPSGDISPGGLRDFIYWRPNAAGTGVEPVYVMLSDPLDSGRFTRKQLDKKYKHAGDFGVSDPKKNSETLTKFRDAIEAHMSDKETVEKGIYRRVKGSKVYFNPESMNVVILKNDGKWLSGWKINPDADNGKIYLETGEL